ncbi:MAG TPA: SPOR domain-containing protein [Terriglobales bacterium]|nr:SPOR domain-containing protein [Terriglobales bacterium]
MTTATSQDTEITLGTGKMLALFFGLVAICAVFFGMGFSLGRSSVRLTSPDLQAAAAAPTAGLRPPAIRNASTTPPADMTFYKAVQSKDDSSQPAPQEASPAPQTAPAPNPTSSVDPAAPPPSNAYYVQVAAVTKAEDAESLIDALKKKQYPAFQTNTPTDKLIHVQVGPYADIKDAEAMRAKLVSDGYNPILKR